VTFVARRNSCDGNLTSDRNLSSDRISVGQDMGNGIVMYEVRGAIPCEICLAFMIGLLVFELGDSDN